MFTHVVIPLEENLAIWLSKLIPPTPITSIWSAGLFSVLLSNTTFWVCNHHAFEHIFSQSNNISAL